MPRWDDSETLARWERMACSLVNAKSDSCSGPARFRITVDDSDYEDFACDTHLPRSIDYHDRKGYSPVSVERYRAV